MPDLVEGTECMFRVSAENIAGVGESSEVTAPVKAKPLYAKKICFASLYDLVF